MSDRAFVTNAKAAWGRILVLQDQDGVDGSTLALAAALWASTNADKLLEIAARASRPTPQIEQENAG